MTDRFPRHKINPEEAYYSLTLSASEDGGIVTSGQTMWVGFSDEDSRIELRKLSQVHPNKMADFWENFGQPFMVVNETSDFFRWWLSGGHVVITHAMLKANMPWELEPRECVKEGLLSGFTSKDSLPKGAFNRAPSPKMRMRVLKRDGYRCKICGRRPADYVDVELHVHHIRPFGQRGLTTDNNLVALCHTCHKGLEPHYELNLYTLIKSSSDEPKSELEKRMLEEYIEGVSRYRKHIKKQIDELSPNNSDQSTISNS